MNLIDLDIDILSRMAPKRKFYQDNDQKSRGVLVWWDDGEVPPKFWKSGISQDTFDQKSCENDTLWETFVQKSCKNDTLWGTFSRKTRKMIP